MKSNTQTHSKLITKKKKKKKKKKREWRDLCAVVMADKRSCVCRMQMSDEFDTCVLASLTFFALWSMCVCVRAAVRPQKKKKNGNTLMLD